MEPDGILNIEKLALLNNLRVNVHQLIAPILAVYRPPQPNTKSQRKRWIQNPYLGKPTERIAEELQKLEYKLVFYPIPSVGQLSVSSILSTTNLPSPDHAYARSK